MRGNRLHRRLDTWAGRAGIALLSALPGARREPAGAPGAVRRVLVVKLAALGDTVLLVPALRALRSRFPGAEVGFVGTAVNREVAGELGGLVERFFCLDPGRAVRSPVYLARFVRELRGVGWDAGVDFDQWTHVTPLLLRMAGVPVRAGFRTPAPLRHRLYTRTVERRTDVHEAVNFLRLAGALGAEGETPPRPALEARPEARDRAAAALAARGWDGRAPLVVVHAGCGHAHARAWPVDRYRAMSAEVAAEDAAPFFVFTGAGAEAADAEALAAGLPGRAAAATGLPLPDLIGLLSHAAVLVSGNTGVMHLAAALGRPQVVLEGPNDERRWGALNDAATVIRSTCPGCPCLDMGWEFHRTDGFCMEQIPVDAVVRATLAALAPATRPKAAAAGG